MGESYGKIVAYIIAILFMTLVPTMLILQKSDDMTQNYVDHKLQEYVDTCRETGQISESAYQRFIENLARTGYGYTITMTCYSKQAIPNTITDNSSVQITSGYTEKWMPTSDLEIEYSLTHNSDGIYRMKQGDYLEVVIECKDTTASTKIFRTLTLGVAAPRTIESRYGGYIGTTAKQ